MGHLMDVFALGDQLVKDYRHYAESFLTIKDGRIREQFESGGLIDELVTVGALHQECSKIFQVGKEPGFGAVGTPLRLYKHQADAIKAAAAGGNYVLTTGMVLARACPTSCRSSITARPVGVLQHCQLTPVKAVADRTAAARVAAVSGDAALEVIGPVRGPALGGNARTFRSPCSRRWRCSS
jgi:hypothetical protein